MTPRATRASEPPSVRPISRFIVMATLQAARAEHLGLPRNSAYSWGLNRAIFYAAAKLGFKRGGPGGGAGERAVGGLAREEYHLGEDVALRDTSRPSLYFTIGDETQTEKEFEAQIIGRFGSQRAWNEAWGEATRIVDEAEPADLTSGSRFYAAVYKPRRDALRERWTELARGPRA